VDLSTLLDLTASVEVPMTEMTPVSGVTPREMTISESPPSLRHVGTRQLGREVNPVVMSKKEFRTKFAAGDRFVSRVSREPKIFVMGDASECGKLAEDRAA
jgi:hypothetical protein